MLKLIAVVLLSSVFVSLNRKCCATQSYRNNRQFDHSHGDFHHHHDHHHHHQHHFNYGNFGGPRQGKPIVGTADNSSLIPMDVFDRMNSYTEIDELLQNFVDGYTKPQDIPLNSRFSDDKKPAVIKAKCPKCEPHLETVEIITEDDPNIVHIPRCVRIERCGGCCATKLQACQPVATEDVQYEIQRLEYYDKGKFKQARPEVRTVERHTKCKCDCKAKPEDCNRYQVYNKAACRCLCSNFEEERKCYEENSTKIWEPDTCSCQCRNFYQCSTGSMYDIISCKCIPFPG